MIPKLPVKNCKSGFSALDILICMVKAKVRVQFLFLLHSLELHLARI